MHWLTLLTAFAVPCSWSIAADSDDEKAKDAAGVFLKALKEKDLKAVCDCTVTPFVYVQAGKPGVHKDAAALKKWFKGRLDVLKEAEVPDGVLGAIPFAKMKSRIKDEKQRAAFAEIMGDEGFVVMLGSKEKGEQAAILVKINKDGKAKVVGSAN